MLSDNTNKFSFLKQTPFIFWTYVVVIVIASVHRYSLGLDHINNFLIFKFSFFNLIEFKDLYIAHPEQYNDLYKYSPAFALLMSVLAFFPTIVGLVAWNLLNGLVLFFAIKTLPVEPSKKTFIWWFVLLELLTSVQNSQSNALVAGLMVLSFTSFEKRNVLLASLFITLSFYIKIFGLAAVVLFLFYPDKLKFMAYMAFWFVIFFLSPLLLVSFEQLLYSYKSWFHLLANDTSHSLNFSVMTLVNSWFTISLKNTSVQLAGLVMLLLPFLNFKSYKNPETRLLFLSSVLIWVIIFNHKAESPTFVIAMTGVALWFSASGASKVNIVLLVMAFILTSLSPTDLFPRWLREYYVVPFVLKVLPCILIWIKIQYELHSRHYRLLRGL